MASKPSITDEEFDLLERTIYRYAVDSRGLVLVGVDVDTARRLAELDYITVRGSRSLPNDAGIVASNDYEHYLEGSTVLRDPLSAIEFTLLEQIIKSANAGEVYEVDAEGLPLAEALAARRLIRLDEDGSAEAERRGHRALFENREHVSAKAKENERVGSAGEVLEELLAALAVAGKIPVSAIFGFVMRQRQRLGRQLQIWAEAKSPLDHCGPGAWKLAGTLTPELRELQGIRCGGLDKAPGLVAAGLAESVDGVLRLSARPQLWHITQAGHLRVAGVDVASGATLGVRAFGAYLHDMGYPKVRARDLRLFRLGRPGEAHALVAPGTLSEVTTSLIGELSLDGGTAAGAGVYLGLSGEQWRRHARVADDRAGPWAKHVLRILPAHPRVITWVLELEEPLGRAVVTDLLEHLLRHGLASRQGADWHRTALGSRAIETEDLIDPYDLWITRHRDGLDRLDDGGAAFLASLRRQLRDRARDHGRSGRNWHTDDTVRSRHLSSVLRQAAERGLGHGCEFAHALWSRSVVELTKKDTP